MLFKKFFHVTLATREDRDQLIHVLEADSDCRDIPDFKQEQLWHTKSKLGESFFCWKDYLVHFPQKLDSPPNSFRASVGGQNSPTLFQKLGQNSSQKVLRHLHLGPKALYELGLSFGCLGGVRPPPLAATLASPPYIPLIGHRLDSDFV
jgi:hypothetical protein